MVPVDIPETRPSKSTLAAMPTTGFGISPTNFDEAWRLAQMISQSNFCPKDYIGKPSDCLFAMAYGAELGLSMLQAIQGIAVIKGRPSVWGDALIGIVRANPTIISIEEFIAGEGDARTATCILTRERHGRAEQTTGTFSVAQARTANLWGKEGPWRTYPDRMLKMRARGFCLRDGAADILKGIITAEEAYDIPQERNVTPPPTVAEMLGTDDGDDRDKYIDDLMTQAKWTRARVEIEFKNAGGDKDALIKRLESDVANIKDRSGRASHAKEATKAAENDVKGTDATNQKMTAKTRNHLFAILTELSLAEKVERISWANAILETNDATFITSFSELLEPQALVLLDEAQAMLAFQKGTTHPAPIATVNEHSEPCEYCAAKTGEEHASGCPSVHP